MVCVSFQGVLRSNRDLELFDDDFKKEYAHRPLDVFEEESYSSQ